jgi:hypothetical protein
MKSEESDTATGTSDETEPIAGTEQTESESEPTSFEQALLRAAKEEGHTIGDEPPKAEASEAEKVSGESEEPEAEAASEPETEPETEEKSEEPEEEEKPAAKKEGEKLVPLSEVLKERAKKTRAREAADAAELRVRELEQQLQKAIAPVPTEDNPFIDIQDVPSLDKLERSYESTIDLVDENIERAREEGNVEVPVGTNPDGTQKIRAFSAEQLSALKRRAEKAAATGGRGRSSDPGLS